jgi:hypothetical protein
MQSNAKSGFAHDMQGGPKVRDMPCHSMAEDSRKYLVVHQTDISRFLLSVMKKHVVKNPDANLGDLPLKNHLCGSRA